MFFCHRFHSHRVKELQGKETLCQKEKDALQETILATQKELLELGQRRQRAQAEWEAELEKAERYKLSFEQEREEKDRLLIIVDMLSKKLECDKTSGVRIIGTDSTVSKSKSSSGKLRPF